MPAFGEKIIGAWVDYGGLDCPVSVWALDLLENSSYVPIILLIVELFAQAYISQNIYPAEKGKHLQEIMNPQ